MNVPDTFDGLDTPRLILDADRMERNAARMRSRCDDLGVMLRPHLKTAKSVDVARIAADGRQGPITVSTLAEADHFAAAGWQDLLYSTAITPAKLARVHDIQREYGARLLLVIDHSEVAVALGAEAAALGARFEVLIEIDCGEHRSGVAPASEETVSIADSIAACSPYLELKGVMTHAGHSYALNNGVALAVLAEAERGAAVESAKLLRSRGHACPIVSVGSTPTALFARDLHGVTEVRAGIYLFWDLSQLSRGMCREEDLAVSVLATIIGHQRNGPGLILDAGALALSKDVGAKSFMPHAGYGLICNAETLEPIDNLAVSVVHQEHGSVPLPDESWFERMPLGSRVRILPNHACLTCAAYPSYDVLRNGKLVERWSRVNGW